MTAEVSDNKYAQLLKEQGNYVLTIEGIDWYSYSGFMMPAYLPHCCPVINPQIAEQVMRISGQPFARWDSRFAEIDNSQWWYVLKRSPWAIENVKNKKKRWMIRQGKKHFSVRPLTFDEVVAQCPRVAQLATARYKGKAEVETREILQERVRAGNKVPGGLEYIGCFHEDMLVSFSENYIQDNKHLPEIPSAEEMKENGVGVADLQMKLLQKIEELTLYVIDLKKENDTLKERISTLEEK